MIDFAIPHTSANPGTSGNSLMTDLFLNPLLGTRRMSVAAGTVLYEPPSPANSVYYIHRGQVRLFQVGPDNSAQLIDILGPNEWFGSGALAQVPRYRTRAVAVTSSIISEIPADRLLATLAQQPRAAIELIKVLATKLGNAREDASRLIFDDCHARLLTALIRFSRSAAATPQPNGVILHITHQQLAQAIGVARETVSLALTELRHQNLLRTGRNQLTFDPAALQQFLKHCQDHPTQTESPIV